MSDTTHYSDAEWSLIKAAPHWIFAALSAADGRSGSINKRKETVAMNNVLEATTSDNVLVSAATEAEDADEGISRKTTYDEAKAKLAELSKILENKVGREEGEEYRDFLMDVGNEIAAAAQEGFGIRKDAVSEEEAAALADIANVLEATAMHKQRRFTAERAEEAAAKRKADSAKRAAAARAKADADRKAARAEAKAKAADAHKARIAAAKKKAAEDKKKAAAAAAAKAKIDAARASQRAAAQRQAKLAKDNAAAASAAAKAEAAAAAKAAAEAAAAVAAAEAAAKAAIVAEHTVQGGDSLSAIAWKYYGSGSRANWMAIYEANKELIGGNPGLIRPGQVLTIPALG